MHIEGDLEIENMKSKHNLSMRNLGRLLSPFTTMRELNGRKCFPERHIRRFHWMTQRICRILERAGWYPPSEPVERRPLLHVSTDAVVMG